MRPTRRSRRSSKLPNKHVDERIEQDEHLAGDAAIAKARALLPSFRAAMFVTRLADGTHFHSRPLALQGDPSVFGGALWFFADDRSPKVDEFSKDPRVTLLFQNDDDSNYLQLDGAAAVIQDKAKMRELYTPVLKTWFPEGLDDPHLILIRFDATTGAFWESPGGMLQAITAFATAVVTRAPGKSGNSGSLSF